MKPFQPVLRATPNLAPMVVILPLIRPLRPLTLAIITVQASTLRPMTEESAPVMDSSTADTVASMAAATTELVHSG
jgi:hypothetical protein